MTESFSSHSAKTAWHVLEHQVWREIHKLQIEKDLRILLGISGGADSMALLEVFRVLKKTLSFELFVCHVHHGENGVSQETLRFRQQSLLCVKKYCETHQLNFITKKHLDLKLNSEQEFRNFRLKSFVETMLEVNAPILCLAHHAEDLLETRLLRLIRGTGLLGLESMKVYGHREWNVNNQLYPMNIFRPFLENSKADLIQYCSDKKISFIEDPSNSESDYLRNFLRNEWLPLLEKKQEGALKAMSRSLQILVESVEDADQEILHAIHLTEEKVQIDKSVFCFYSSEEKKRTVVLMLHRLGIRDFSAGQVNEILKNLDNSKKIHTFVLGSVVWNVDAKQISIRRK